MANAPKNTVSADEAKKMLEEAQAAMQQAEQMMKQASEEMAAVTAARAELDAMKAKNEGMQATTGSDAEDATKKRRAYLNELVPFRLFKDNDKYKDDVLVCVNGERWLIKRGEDVMIPRKVALVLERSQRQDAATANLIEQVSAEFEAKAKALNI